MSDTKAQSKPIAQPIPSATVLVLRDGPTGVEVFMLVRNRQVDFASGALVFPGGKVDQQDHGDEWASLAGATGSHPPLPYWVAALRETFEETGLLIANHRESGAPIDAQSASDITRAAQFKVGGGEVLFASVLQNAALTLGTQRLVPFAHWITPTTMPKRFDTHFFLAEAPIGQIAVHDGGETVESVWISPRQALAEAETGTRVLVPATALNLEKLALSPTVAHAVEEARSSRIVPITPTVAKAEGGVRISIPADSGYETTSVYVPRPSPA